MQDLKKRIQEILDLGKAIDDNCRKRGFTGFIELDYDDYLEAREVIEKLTEREARLILALKHCINVLDEYERKPGEDLRGFMLGSLDNAKATFAELGIETGGE